jgi:Dolichyl-phosphate-mannose-protein mannosyltransferase
MRLAVGLLPPLVFCCLATSLYIFQQIRGAEGPPSFRNCLLQSAALCGLWVVLGTESFSVLRMLSFWPVLAWWLLPLIVCLLYISTHFKHASFAWPRPRPSWAGGMVLGLLVIFTALALISAIFSPPNNYDSLSYHLPRQIIWMQQHSVRHYPTNNLRQTMMPPFTEFADMQVWILSNSDRLLNLVQWAAMVVMFSAVSLITERLGGDRRVQWLACLLLISSPIVFLQASNTKNDMVVGLWVTTSLWWLLRVLDGWNLTWFDAILFGSALGCGGESKGTGPIFLLPVVLILTFAMLRRRSFRSFAMLASMGAIGLAINAPHYVRNDRTYGHLNGPTVAEGSYPIYNTLHTPEVVASNALRILACESALPSQRLNDRLYDGLAWIHEHVLHLGLNDKRTTSPFSKFVPPRYRANEEDVAGSPLHVLLFLTLPAALLLARRRIQLGPAVLVSCIGVGGFLTFCALLKWDEWTTRYFIATTALLCPVAAVALAGGRRGAIVSTMLAILATVALYPSVRKNSRPVFGPSNIFRRSDLTARLYYVTSANDDFQDLADIAKRRNVKWVGIATDGDGPDYDYMYVIRKAMQSDPPSFEYVAPFCPVRGYVMHRADMVIARPALSKLTDHATHTHYVLARQYSTFNLLLPEGASKIGGGSPAFIGWNAVDGITPVLGPFPQWNLPRVRWGLYPATHLRVRILQAGRYAFVCRMRRNDNLKQTMTIDVNGRDLKTYHFSDEFKFEPLTLDLKLNAGVTHIALRYGSGDQDGPPNRAVLFSTLQVIPVPK